VSEDVISALNLQFWKLTTSAGHQVSGYHSVPSGRPVIHFIHGNGYNGLTYLPMLKALSSDYDLFISDIQGHGESEAGNGFLGWNETAQLCDEVWRQFRHHWSGVPNYGVGHSFGGIMTSFMMVRDPALFERAVLLDPIIFSPSMLWVMRLGTAVGLWQKNGMASRTRRRRREWPDREAAYQAFQGRGMFRGWQDEALWAYVNHALKETGDGVGLKCPPELEADIFSGFPRRLWRTLKQVPVPTHVIHGTDTYDFVLKSVGRLESLNPRFSVEAVSGGHCFMQQQPALAAERVKAALT